MNWKYGEDISCFHASQSLEEVRNRRVLVREGEHVEYDQLGRAVQKVKSKIPPIKVDKALSSASLNFDIKQSMGTLKTQFSDLLAPVLKHGENSLRKIGNIASCFKPREMNEVQSSEPFAVMMSGLLSSTTIPKATSTKCDGSTPLVNSIVRKKPDDETKAHSDAKLLEDSLKSASIARDECEPKARGNQESERVKSKLPNQEPVPFVESGFVKRAVRSYTFNVVNAGGVSTSIEGKGLVTLKPGTASKSNGYRQYSFSELGEDSVVSSRSESPISDTGTKFGKENSRRDYKVKVKNPDDFKSSYVARVAESYDYFIKHEQTERYCRLRPKSPLSR